jgi:hypothetical protein
MTANKKRKEKKRKRDKKKVQDINQRRPGVSSSYPCLVFLVYKPKKRNNSVNCNNACCISPYFVLFCSFFPLGQANFC